MTLEAGQHCVWQTSNGSHSSITISTPDHANTLTCQVDGAPDEVMATAPDGTMKPFNGAWKIPANAPNATVTASADFQGHDVTVTNRSRPATPCHIETYVPGH